jgi:hypothetical protein
MCNDELDWQTCSALAACHGTACEANLFDAVNAEPQLRLVAGIRKLTQGVDIGQPPTVIVHCFMFLETHGATIICPAVHR